MRSWSPIAIRTVNINQKGCRLANLLGEMGIVCLEEMAEPDHNPLHIRKHFFTINVT